MPPPFPALDTVAQVEPQHGNSTVLIRMREGAQDYSGQLMADVDFGGFSHSALVRIADEVCLQMHLLNLSFNIAVRERQLPMNRPSRSAKQLTGIAGVAAGANSIGSRPVRGSARTVDGPRIASAAQSQRLCGERRRGRPLADPQSPAHLDGAWIALCSPTSPSPLQASPQPSILG